VSAGLTSCPASDTVRIQNDGESHCHRPSLRTRHCTPRDDSGQLPVGGTSPRVAWGKLPSLTRRDVSVTRRLQFCATRQMVPRPTACT
jgi:hypothetical protein